MIANWMLKLFILLYRAVQIDIFYESLTRTSGKTSTFPEAPPFRAGIAASFSGGQETWIKYLSHNLNYPPQAEKKKAEAVIRIQFTVDTTGNVIDVKALNDEGYGFSAEAERVLSKSPKWKPARLDGKKMEYRLVQSVAFRLN